MIYDLTPSAHRTIWGGQNLERLKNLPVDKTLDPYGETWEISVHPQGPSLIDGKKIEEVVGGSIPYMVKFIDTAKALSIQVHPDDEYARIHENSSGKAECYLILEAADDAILYLGMKQGVTKGSFLEGLKNKKNMSEFLNAFKVKKGDFFFTPPGSVHAIGAGITMVEVQQSSGITYRVWDWDRLDSSGKPRQLHIDKSLDVLNFDPKKNTREFFRAASGLFNHIGRKRIVEHNTFNFSLINLTKGETIELEIKDYGRLASVLNLQGKITVNDKTVETYSSVLLKDEKTITVVALEATSFLLIE